SMFFANFLRMVPSSASSGFVAPITSRHRLIASSALEHHYDYWAFRDERDQPAEKRPFFVNLVEALGLLLREAYHLHATYAKASFLSGRRQAGRRNLVLAFAPKNKSDCLREVRQTLLTLSGLGFRIGGSWRFSSGALAEI